MPLLIGAKQDAIGDRMEAWRCFGRARARVAAADEMRGSLGPVFLFKPSGFTSRSFPKLESACSAPDAFNALGVSVGIWIPLQR